MARRQFTLKQLRWVDEMLIDGNATKAAERAGYSKKSVKQQGTENLAKPSLMALLEQKRLERSERTEYTADQVLQELAKIGFSNIADFIEIGEDGTPRTKLASTTREQLAAVAEITIDEYMDGPVDNPRPVRKVKIKLADKKSALAEMGKHLGVAKNVKVSTPHGKPLLAVTGTLTKEDVESLDSKILIERLRGLVD